MGRVYTCMKKPGVIILTNGVSLLETQLGNRKMNYFLVVQFQSHRAKTLKAAMIHATRARKEARTR
jgi:hypothetical protein